MSLEWRIIHQFPCRIECDKCDEYISINSFQYSVVNNNGTMSLFCQNHFPVKLWDTVSAYAKSPYGDIVVELFSIDAIRNEYGHNRANRFAKQKI